MFSFNTLILPNSIKHSWITNAILLNFLVTYNSLKLETDNEINGLMESNLSTFTSPKLLCHS